MIEMDSPLFFKTVLRQTDNVLYGKVWIWIPFWGSPTKRDTCSNPVGKQFKKKKDFSSAQDDRHNTLFKKIGKSISFIALH